MISPALTQGLIHEFGSKARDWLPQAESQIDALAYRWGVQLTEPLHGATCSVVIAGLRLGEKVVLKLPYPEAEEADSISTMLAFASVGGVDVLESDSVSGAVLMPRLDPGLNLVESGASEEEAIDVCAELILQLREAPQIDRPDVWTWHEFLGKMEDPMAVEAAKIAVHLHQTSERKILLHGDFHHFNTLRSGDRWVVVDPKGLLGDPAFEVVGFMRNPEISKDPNLTARLRYRLHRFARHLGDDPARLWGWSFVQTVSGGFWSSVSLDSPWRKTAASLWELRDEFWPRH